MISTQACCFSPGTDSKRPGRHVCAGHIAKYSSNWGPQMGCSIVTRGILRKEPLLFAVFGRQNTWRLVEGLFPKTTAYYGGCCATPKILGFMRRRSMQKQEHRKG